MEGEFVMRIRILTSMFPNGFTKEFEKEVKRLITKRENFVFIASEFEKDYDITERYYDYFFNMFTEKGIYFEHKNLIDSRMPTEKAQRLIEAADVVWIAGGDTPTQFEYLKKYDLIDSIKNASGVVIGMSAGSINMGNIAICTIDCGHTEEKIYEGLGLVDISVEPHFDRKNVSKRTLELSKQYSIYGMCDDSAVIYEDEKISYFGDIVLIRNESIKSIL